MRDGRPAQLQGRVLFDDGRGIQTIATDSLIHPIIKCVGINHIDGARPGDKVLLTYRIDPQLRFGMWFGRRIE
jgi:hypothetical protein